MEGVGGIKSPVLPSVHGRNKEPALIDVYFFLAGFELVETGGALEYNPA